jgi:hypothetical protein
MTMEATLFNALKVICPRAYPDIAPTSTVRPYVTFQQIGGDTLDPLDNSAPGKRNAVMQINVWSNTRAEAVALMDQIEDSLRTVLSARPQSAKFNDYDNDMLVYSSQQEFRYWY